VIVGVIRRKPVLTYASIVCDMLASVNSVNEEKTTNDVNALTSDVTEHSFKQPHNANRRMHAHTRTHTLALVTWMT